MDRTSEAPATVTRFDYPLSTERPELLKTHHGSFTDITIKNLKDGKLTKDHLRICRETLELQAQIAHDAGRCQLADNLYRAAELTEINDCDIIEFYNAMRPSVATPECMREVAKKLDDKKAPRCAELVREAAKVYEQRKLFTKQDETARCTVDGEEKQR